VTDYPVHRLCNSLHAQTGSFVSDARYWLDELTKLRQFGFAAGTLPMLQMADDVRNLRMLATAIEKQHQLLMQPEKINESV
jgi:hypothetical protein